MSEMDRESEHAGADLPAEGGRRPWGPVVLAPRDTARPRSTGRSALEERASILSRVLGEAADRNVPVWLEQVWHGRPGKDAVFHLVVHAAGVGRAHVRGESGRESAELGALRARLLGALEDHSPFRWAVVSAARHRRLEDRVSGGALARLYLRAAAGAGQPLEVYPIRSSTIEQALRRLKEPTTVRVRMLVLPRRRGVSLRRPTSSHTYGRLVPVGAPAPGDPDGPLQSDAAELWQFLVQVEVASRGEVSHDLMAAVAADVRGTGAGSVGIVLGGHAAAVDAEWHLEAGRGPAAPDEVGWPADTVLLNLREASCLAPFPAGPDPDAPTSERLARVPDRLPRKGLVVGTVTGTRRPVAIPWPDTFRHAFLIGATGSGKSTALLNATLQAIRSPRRQAVIVFDPHGSLGDTLLGLLTLDEQDRLVLFDPSDPVAPMTFNPLADGLPISADTVVTWAWEQFDPHRTMTAGMGPIVEQTLRAALATVMARPGSTLVDAFEIIQDDAKAKPYLPLLRDEAVIGFWRMRAGMNAEQKGHYSNYLTSKLSPFAHDLVLRNVVARTSTLDIPGVLADGRILLVSIRKAVVGAETTTMLVRLLKRFVWREITARGAGGDDQVPVQLVIDEFIDYQQPELDATMLQAGRKFHTSLLLATQNLAAIDHSLREAIAANAASLLAFRVGIYDAPAVASMLGDQSISADLTTLPNFRAVARVPLAGEPMPPVLVDASKPPKGFSPDTLEHGREISRSRYGVPFADPSQQGTGASDDAADTPGPTAPEEIVALPPAPEAVLGIIRAAGIAAELDDDGDVRVVGALPSPIFAMVEGSDLRFLVGFSCRARTSRAARLALANEINDRLRIVRATVSSSAGVEFDWYLHLAAGMPASAVTDALAGFASAVHSALKVDADGRRILVTA